MPQSVWNTGGSGATVGGTAFSGTAINTDGSQGRNSAGGNGVDNSGSGRQLLTGSVVEQVSSLKVLVQCKGVVRHQTYLLRFERGHSISVVGGSTDSG